RESLRQRQGLGSVGGGRSRQRCDPRGSRILYQTPPRRVAKVPLSNQGIGRGCWDRRSSSERVPISDSSFSNSKIVPSRLNSRVRTGNHSGAPGNESSAPRSCSCVPSTVSVCRGGGVLRI